MDENLKAQQAEENMQAKVDEKLKDFLAYARKKKNLVDYADILDFFADLQLDDEQKDRVMETLKSNGISVFLQEEELDIIDDEEIIIDDDEEEIDMENIDPSVPEGVGIEDPVRMYLKEIG